jgi:zinc transporter
MNYVPMPALIDPQEVPQDGMLFAWAIPASGQGYEIRPENINQALADPDISLWLHLNFANVRVNRWLADSGLFPTELLESITEETMEVGYDAIHEFKTGVLFHLKDFTLDFGQVPESNNLDFESFWCYMTDRLLVTGRVHPLKTFDYAKLQLLRGVAKPKSVHQIFHQLIDTRSVRLKASIRRLSDRIDYLEEIILNGNDLPADESIGALRIQCSRVRRHFTAELDALKHFQKKSSPIFHSESREELNEHTTELSSFLGQIDNLYVRAKVLQDEQASHVAELNAKQLQTLSVMTVIFLPMTLISGIMGMNMEDLPGLKESFPTVMVIMALAGAAVYLGLKIKRII